MGVTLWLGHWSRQATGQQDLLYFWPLLGLTIATAALSVLRADCKPPHMAIRYLGMRAAASNSWAGAENVVIMHLQGPSAP